MQFPPYSILHRPTSEDSEDPKFSEGFGLRLDTSECSDLGQLRDFFGARIARWVDTYGLVHMTHVDSTSVPDEFFEGRTGENPTLWHVDRNSNRIVALGHHSGADTAPTRFVVRSEARHAIENSPACAHLGDNPLLSRPNKEIFLQTLYKLALNMNDGSHAVVHALASGVSQCGSVIKIDWAQYPNGMVFFESAGLKGDRVLHGCFADFDLDAMKRKMKRSLRYYSNFQIFFT